MTSCSEAIGWEFGYFEKQSVGDKMPNWKPTADRGLWTLSDQWLSNPAEMRKKYCCVSIAVCHHLQLISHTQPTSTLSRIKCERYIFIKKCVRSFIEVCHYCWLCFRLYLYYVYICGYTTDRYYSECCTLSWTNPESNTKKQQLYDHLPSISQTSKDEQDIWALLEKQR